jgi:hypothetical protein
VRSRCLNEFFLLARMQSDTASLIVPLLAEKQKSIRHPQKPKQCGERRHQCIRSSFALSRMRNRQKDPVSGRENSPFKGAEQGRKRGPARPCAPQSARPDERPAEKKADVRHPGAAPSQASAGTLDVDVAPSKRKTRKAGTSIERVQSRWAKRLKKYWHGGQHACQHDRTEASRHREGR